MREAFDKDILNAVAWSPGYYLGYYSLTKDIRKIAALLKRVLREGRYPPHPEAIVRSKVTGEVGKQGKVSLTDLDY